MNFFSCDNFIVGIFLLILGYTLNKCGYIIHNLTNISQLRVVQHDLPVPGLNVNHDRDLKITEIINLPLVQTYQITFLSP